MKKEVCENSPLRVSVLAEEITDLLFDESKDTTLGEAATALSIAISRLVLAGGGEDSNKAEALVNSIAKGTFAMLGFITTNKKDEIHSYYHLRPAADGV